MSASVLLHVVFILALLPRSPEGLSGGGSGGTAVGAGTGETYAAVDLYAVQPATAATTAIKTPDNIKADALDTPVEVAKLDSPQITPMNNVPQLAPAETALSGAAGQAGTTAGAGDDLWGAIAPCWKRVAGKDTLPVTLKVTFASGGGLSKPPEIVRADGAAITPQSLHSEARGPGGADAMRRLSHGRQPARRGSPIPHARIAKSPEVRSGDCFSFIRRGGLPPRPCPGPGS